MIIMNNIKMTLNRGSIILVLFPNSDLVTAKRRPALIIQTNNLQTGLNQIIIAMITSQISRANHPSRIKILLDSTKGNFNRIFRLRIK